MYVYVEGIDFVSILLLNVDDCFATDEIVAMVIKMETNNSNTVRTVPKSNRKIVE
jgi:hypothetical protein